MSKSKLLTGKTALITGCNRGIGKETLRQLIINGADVVCLIRKENPDFNAFAMPLAEENGVKIITMSADFSDEESVKNAVRTLIKDKTRIDILINNAGVATGGLLQMTSMATLHDVFQINFFSQVLLTQMISRIMMRQRCGSIINLGSVAGLDSFAGYTAYGSSKAALMFFTKTAARELAPYGIRVNAVAPGLTKTGMADAQEPKSADEMIGRTSFKRLGLPEEIANAIIFLVSDKASFITGQILRVDGGM